jgi:hypothetical protein
MTSVLPSEPQISDFFGAYPSIDITTPTNESIFNTLIAKKAEFNELKSKASEPIPPRGEGFPHQKFNVRYLTWYDRLMMVHDPGTGKSCIITHSAELFKNEYLKDPDDPTKIRQAVILLHGEALRENIRNEIVCKCTDRVYETEKVINAPNESAMKSNLTDELKVWYDITTYEIFAKQIRKFEREEDLEEYMSNRVFYIDEVQGVPSLKDIRNPSPPPQSIDEARSLAEQRTAEYRERERRRGRIVDEKSRGETNYETIWRAFHKGKRNKIVLATATPMTNTPNDIIPLINLLLPLEHQMPFFPMGTVQQQADFANQPFEFFEPYFRGRVSYVRASISGVVEQPMGVVPANIDTSIYPCDMSVFQYYAYLQASMNTPTRQSSEEVREGFYRQMRYASNFVFPDGTYGTNAFSKDNNKYIEKDKDRYRFRNTPDGRYLRQLVGSEAGLPYLSGKYANIIDFCNESFPRARPVTDDNLGIVFVYFPDFVHGSGAIVLGLCFEENGYEEFRETHDIFIGTQQKNMGLSFGPCASPDEVQGERDARIPKRKRYAILTNETPKSRIHTIFNTLNAYENRYGEYLQVLIGSQTAREGININNAVKMIMASSSWNYSSNTQAKDRVFRTNSLASRLEEKRERFANEGLSTDDVVIPIQTYNMASVYQIDENEPEEVSQVRNYLQNIPPENRDTFQRIFFEENSNTIDAQLYARSEEKDRLIRQIMRYAKRSSIDCYLNKQRNVLPTDVSGSPECDYLPCDYECAGIRPELIKPLDKTTKILYYSDEEINQAIAALRKIFSRFHSLRIEQVHQLVQEMLPLTENNSNFETIFIDMAIQKMIKDNIRLLDRMGFYSYLRESDNGVIYLEKDPFEIRARPESTAYSSVLIGTQDIHNNTFADYVSEMNIISEEPQVRELIQTNPESHEFIQLLNNLSIANKVILLEQALYEKMNTGMTNDFYKAIISSFNDSIFAIAEPVDALREALKILSNRGKTRGRKPKPNSQPNIKKFNLEELIPTLRFDPMIQAGKVILHTLYNQESNDRTKYGAVTRYRKAEGRIRILKTSEGVGWRDVEMHEYVVYNHLIQQRLSQIRQHYEQFPIYGIMLPPKNEFHLRDRENENTNIQDGRTIYDGRVCHNWLKPILIDILYRLGVSINQQIPENITRQQIIAFLLTKKVNIDLNTMNDDKLLYFYKWYQTNLSRYDICRIIKERLEQTGRLLTGSVPARVQGENPLQTGPTSGSIQSSPDLTTVDYSRPFNMPTANIPQIPAQVLPEFAASAGQEIEAEVNQVNQIPTNQMYDIPQTQSQITQPSPQPYETDLNTGLDLSSNVGPQSAMGLSELQPEGGEGIRQ